MLQSRSQFWSITLILILDESGGSPVRWSWRVTRWSLSSTETFLATVFIEKIEDFRSCEHSILQTRSQFWGVIMILKMRVVSKHCENCSVIMISCVVFKFLTVLFWICWSIIVITWDHDVQRNIMTRFITTGLENDFHKSDQSIFHDDLSKSLTAGQGYLHYSVCTLWMLTDLNGNLISNFKLLHIMSRHPNLHH